MKSLVSKKVLYGYICWVCLIGCADEKINVMTYDIDALSFGDRDITGWGQLYWGMPFEDVAAIYELSEWKTYANQYYRTLVNSDFTIGQGIGTVAVAFFTRPDAEGQLIKIKLTHISKKPTTKPFDESPVRNYLDDLIGAYGQPNRIARKSESGKHVYFFWEKPSGWIDAKLVQFDHPENRVFYLFNVEFYSRKAF